MRRIGKLFSKALRLDNISSLSIGRLLVPVEWKWGGELLLFSLDDLDAQCIAMAKILRDQSSQLA